jgi:hypothetical protein
MENEQTTSLAKDSVLEKKDHKYGHSHDVHHILVIIYNIICIYIYDLESYVGRFLSLSLL